MTGWVVGAERACANFRTRVRVLQMLAVWQMLLFGAISGAASEASTYPLDLVRRRLQIRTGIAPATDSLARMLSIAQQIVAREGPRGLYAGLAPSVLQVGIARW